MADTMKASWITDHAFEPRLEPRPPTGRKAKGGKVGHPLPLSPNPYLCGYRRCRLAEAAHRETTMNLEKTCGYCGGAGCDECGHFGCVPLHRV